VGNHPTVSDPQQPSFVSGVQGKCSSAPLEEPGSTSAPELRPLDVSAHCHEVSSSSSSLQLSSGYEVALTHLGFPCTMTELGL
jgi:hypothetical protein